VPIHTRASPLSTSTTSGTRAPRCFWGAAFTKLVGAEENNAGDIRKRMEPLTKAAQSHDLAVLIVRNAGKDGKGRGSSQFEPEVDIVATLKRPEGNHADTVRHLETDHRPLRSYEAEYRAAARHGRRAGGHDGRGFGLTGCSTVAVNSAPDLSGAFLLSSGRPCVLPANRRKSGEGGIRTHETASNRLRDFQSRSFGQLGHLSEQQRVYQTYFGVRVESEDLCQRDSPERFAGPRSAAVVDIDGPSGDNSG
jgi:hypothetical protein